MKRLPGQGGEAHFDDLYTGKYLELAEFAITGCQLDQGNFTNPLMTVIKTEAYDPENERVLLEKKLDGFIDTVRGFIANATLDALAVLEDDKGELYIGARDGDWLPLDIAIQGFSGEELAIPFEIRARSLAIFDALALRRITELPKVLGQLKLENVRLDILPEFPEGLVNLTIGRCGYIEVVGLPDSLDLLIVNHCHVENDMVLPSSLKTLRFEGVEFLNKTAPNLPASLEYFKIVNSNVSKLSDLPQSLTGLFCEHNGLYKLPKLPSGLIALYCGYNPLLSLPVLPDTLEELGCTNNENITSLPKLPRSLKSLQCLGTKLGPKKKQKLRDWAEKNGVTLYA